MSDFLSIRLRDAELTPLSIVSWVVLEPSSQVVASGDCLLQDLPSEVPEQSGSRRIIVIVPSEHILLTTVAVPEGQRRHLKQVLPFMVEEKIIDPIEAMHIVTPPIVGDGQVLVGCIKRAALQHWLEFLESVDIKPDYLFADAHCITGDKGDWQLLLDEQRVLLGSSPSDEKVAPFYPAAMALDHQTVMPVLEMILSQCSESDANFELANDDLLDDPLDGPLDGPLDSESDEGSMLLLRRPASVALIRAKSEPLENLIAAQQEQLRRASSEQQDDTLDGDSGDKPDRENTSDEPVAEEASLADTYSSSAPTNPLQDDERKALSEYLRSENIEAPLVDYRETTSEVLSIAAVRNHDKPLNFLQGEFTPINANAATRSFMRRVVLASAACLVLFLGFSVAGGFYLDNRADSSYKKSVAIYKELFPGERIRNPVRQMKSKLKSGNVGATSSDFLPLLDVASKSLETLGKDSEQETTIKQLRYDAQRGNVTMELQAANIDLLESYRDMLTGEGLSVDILSANQDGEIVNGRLQIGRS